MDDLNLSETRGVVCKKKKKKKQRECGGSNAFSSSERGEGRRPL